MPASPKRELVLTRPVADNYEKNFLALFEKLPARAVFERYASGGGNPAFLRVALYQLWPGTRHPSRPAGPRYAAKLRQCEKALSEVLAAAPFTFDGPDAPLRWILRDARRAVREELERLRDHTTKPGRPPGTTLGSLISAVIAHEFRRVLGAPHYRDISALVTAVAPDAFPQSNQAHIQQRTHDVTQAAIDDCYRKLTFFAPLD